ncbi:hypothetical protein UY3_13368 [Chelonia mydas]|uniref:Uncharacterized protein n=1 Tax=Chelonia mydas TaxID=8469 RepID=M7BBI2_CHEMY|nr:hypothetical protein UY3_13368 [Chelonia mydas]
MEQLGPYISGPVEDTRQQAWERIYHLFELLLHQRNKKPNQDDFDQVLGTVPSSEPTAVHNDLDIWDGELLAPQHQSQQLVLDEATKLTLVVKQVPKVAFAAGAAAA